MQDLIDYLKFRRFSMPAFLQLLFWAGIGGTIYGSWWLFSHNSGWWFVALIGGIVMTRLIVENFMLRFQTYVALVEIRDRLYGKL